MSRSFTPSTHLNMHIAQARDTHLLTGHILTRTRTPIPARAQGKGVPPKYTSRGWNPPTDTPANGYGGPYPMERFLADWGAK